MSRRQIIQFGLLLLVLGLGVWLIARPAQLQPESQARFTAVRALAPSGISAAGAAGQAVALEAIEPVVVNLTDIPPNVYDPNNLYDRWLRGEADLDENEYRVSPQEIARLQEEALALPPNAAIQIAQSGPGLNAPVLGTNFDSLDRSECCGGGSVVPPDPIMAAGPNHLIAIVNLAFEIYDKSGATLAGPTTMASFFASVGTGCASNPFDPNVVYDEEADRWIIAADGNGTHYCIAVSQTANPTGAYNLYSVPAQPVGGEFHDYPHTGVGDNYIVAGGNQFGGAIPGGFEGRVWAMNKSVMYAGGVLTPVTFSTGDEGTPQPLHLTGYNQGTWPNLGDTHYFATDPYNGCTVNIWQWDIPAAPAIVSTYNLCTATGVPGGAPVPFPQSGGNNIQGNDWRMREFEYRNGYGWIADSISCNPGAGTVDCVRWHQVDLDGTPSLVQAGVYASDGEYRTFPDLAVNHCNDMVVGYTKSSASMFPSIWYTGRESTDPVGTLQAEAQLKAGEITYTAFDTPPHRWGDYTGMTIDPDGLTFWYLGQYSKNITGVARWGTYIGSFTYPDCSADSEIVVTPATLDVSQLITTVVSHTLTISNTGASILNWTIEEEEGVVVAAEGLAAPTVRLPAVGADGFRYYVENGGPSGVNSNYIGIDTVEYVSNPASALCSTPGDIPWLEVNPSSGATATGSSSEVSVTFDSSGLTVGSTYTGTLCINSDDPVTPLVTVPVTLTVMAALYGVDLAAEDANLSGFAGSAVVYTLWVSNTGNVQDTFDLAVSDNNWDATLSQDSIILAAGESAMVQVTVDIPADAEEGDTDTATVTATSQNDPTATASVELTTTTLFTVAYGVDLAAEDDSLTGEPGAVVTYTLWITNTGNVQDTFGLAVNGNDWTTTLADSSVTLDAGASTAVQVTVNIPADAEEGDTDTAVVSATSQADPTATVLEELTTTAATSLFNYSIYLPVILKP